MQNAAFRAVGLRWTYELLDVAPEGLFDAVAMLRDRGVLGANVTTPHKVAVAGLLDSIDDESSAIGAVNTIVNERGRLLGLNTDVGAIRTALVEVGFQPGMRAVVLGAGGAARAAVIATGEGADITVVARNPARATFATKVLDWNSDETRRECARADVLINATPLGRLGEKVLERQDLPRRGVIDLVYRDGATPLVDLARAAGLGCVDGWEVLLMQGAESFKAWTGLDAPIGAMREALQR